MKPFDMLKAAATVVCCLSCTQEMIPEGCVSSATTTLPVPVTLDAVVGGDAATRLALDSVRFRWDEGDIIYARSASETWPSAGCGCDTITAARTGATSRFAGTLRYDYAQKRNVYCYFCKSNGFSTSSAAAFDYTVPEVQTGTAVTDEVLLWAMIPWKDVTPEYGLKDAPDSITSYALKGTFKPHLSYIRLNVSESMDVRRITVTGTNLRGRITLRTGCAWGTLGSKSSDFYTLQNTAGDIIVERGGKTIAGEVYIAVVADAFDAGTSNYCNSSESLKFVFENASGRKATVEKTLRKKITLGQIKDLGDVSQLTFKSLMTGSLVFVQDNTLTLSVKDTAAGSSFYYEVGDGAVGTPTITSDRFYASKGFTVQASDTYNEKLVKVLVHCDDGTAEDLVLCGYLRNWRTVAGCGILSAYNKYLLDNGKTSITSADNNSITADGLLLNVPRIGTSYKAYITAKDDYVSLYDAYFIFRTVNDGADSHIRYKLFAEQDSRKIAFYKGQESSGKANQWMQDFQVPDNARSLETCCTMLYSDKTKSLPAGTPLSCWGNISWCVCEISHLETGDAVKIPESKKIINPSFRYTESQGVPTIVVDTAAVGESRINGGVKFHYTTSTVSFDDAPTPTIDSPVLTAEGIRVAPGQIAHDSLYVKILATGDDYQDSYREVFLRSWCFGWLYDNQYKPEQDMAYTYPLFYKGLTFSPYGLGCNKYWRDRAQIKQNTVVTVPATYGGQGMMHLRVGSCSSGGNVVWGIGSTTVGKATIPAFTPDTMPAQSFCSPKSSIAAGDCFKFDFKSWVQAQGIAVMEQIVWSPSMTGEDGLSASDFQDGSEYAF